MLTRCAWPQDHDLMIKYHDEEWGVPLHDDHKLFEFIILDAFQAGLSWKTIINKRENFSKAFDAFDYTKIALYDESKVQSLMQDAGIIRNQLKIRATIGNAKAFMNIRAEFGSFDAYLWAFVDGKPIVNLFTSLNQIPARTPLSGKLSKDLEKRGFKFVGSTIVYAFMQAAGLVNDHTVECFRRQQIIDLY